MTLKRLIFCNLCNRGLQPNEAIGKQMKHEIAKFTIDWFLYGRSIAEFLRANRRHMSTGWQGEA